MKIKTIYSLCTPPIAAALHIIRLCGPKSYEIINKITNKPVSKNGYSLQKNYICDKKVVIDEVILAKFISPKSFTGEDTIEIICHGGIAIVNEILILLSKHGAIQAQNGEFAKIALLNGKIDLTQAEAINSMILAESKIPLLLANKSLAGQTKNLITSLKEELLATIALVEVNIDYPEYDDVEKMTATKLVKKINKICKNFLQTIDESKKVMPIVNGINVAIVGKPNVGKSSLLNALLKENKAIVSNVPGTTRDIVEGRINLSGFTINILDTAGIRKSKNQIEKFGINKSFEQIEKADIIILVLDSSCVLDNDDKSLINLTKYKKRIVVLNKSDLKTKVKIKGIKVSAKSNNINLLIDELEKAFQVNSISVNNPTLQTQRQILLLENALNSLNEALKILNQKMSIDLVEEFLKKSLIYLNEILGETYSEGLLDELFSKFCLGK